MERYERGKGPQCHGKTQAGLRCKRMIEVVGQKTCYTHRDQVHDLPIWEEPHRTITVHVSLATTESENGVVGCAATYLRHTPWLSGYETLYGAMKSTPYFASLIAASWTMETFRPGPIVFHINDAALRWHIDHFKETPATHPAWLRFWDAAQPHEIQVHSRNAENKATEYAEAAAYDGLTDYKRGVRTLHDPSKYQSESARQRKTTLAERFSGGIVSPVPFATEQREEVLMFGHSSLNRICLICSEPSHNDICADCANWG